MLRGASRAPAGCTRLACCRRARSSAPPAVGPDEQDGAGAEGEQVHGRMVPGGRRGRIERMA